MRTILSLAEAQFPQRMFVYAAACSISALAAIRAMLMVFMSRGCPPIKRDFHSRNDISHEPHYDAAPSLPFTRPVFYRSRFFNRDRPKNHDSAPPAKADMTILGHCFFGGTAPAESVIVSEGNVKDRMLSVPLKIYLLSVRSRANFTQVLLAGPFDTTVR